MSYEGYEERLCKTGHYDVLDCYYDFPEKCSICGKPWAYFHLVDQTNGFVEDDPSTHEAAVKSVGWEDLPMKDHYGNAYFLKRDLYKPDSKEWRKFTRPKKATAT